MIHEEGTVTWNLNLTHAHEGLAWLPRVAACAIHMRLSDQILAQVHKQTLAAAPTLHLKILEIRTLFVWTLAQAQDQTKVATARGRLLENGFQVLCQDPEGRLKMQRL